MKKEENLKRNPIKEVNNFLDQMRSRSHSPKAYLGCDTCKQKSNELKKIKSASKFSELNCNMDRNKFNKSRKPSSLEKDREREENGKGKIKLTDLCDEDKKRVVELIEELSKFAEKNQKLKEMLDRMQKTSQEQQDYIMKQANLHLEEKNFYVNEINDYKCKLESLESEIKNKIFQWEKHERHMESEIAYLAKALEESLAEKNDLNEQMNHLKLCLRQSLESFQRLRDDIIHLQHQGKINKKFKSVSCQTEFKLLALKENYKTSNDEETEEEDRFFPPAINQNGQKDAKSSLDVINDKLEHVYQLLKRKSENLSKQNPQKLDIDLSILLKNEKLIDEGVVAEEDNLINISQEDELKEESRHYLTDTGYKFLKPFDYFSKTSIQAERILKKIGKPLNLIATKKSGSRGRNFEISDAEDEESTKNSTHQNDLYKMTEDHHCDEEDRLLEDLFYADRNLNLSLEYMLEEKQAEM